ncbi:MAG: hypothetical protein KAJ92_03475 [Gammaproteobacteria bacterium]|nr:hypothetical protein [Gammaproteobacteria bacterium]MCK5262715.1 hypothetical protein [Gammaproteobacteria bacterium]
MTWFDKIRLYLIYTTAVTLIVLAVAFSVLRAVLPHATAYVDDLEQELTQQIGLPVSIASMDADMYWLVPRLKLVDVVIYDKARQRELLRLDEAIFALAFVDSILQWSPTVGDISLVGADLYIERHINNRWRIQGVEFGGDSTAASGSDSSRELIAAVKNTSFSLLDSDIHWQDYRLRNGQLDFIGANIVIEEFLDDHSLEINLQLPEKYGESLRLIVKTSGDVAHLLEVDLDVYLQAKLIDIGQLTSVLDVKDLPMIKGVFSGELWLSRKDNELSQVTMDASIKQFAAARKNQAKFSLDNVAAKFEWQKTKFGWNFNSSDIYLVKQGQEWPELSSISAAQNATGLSLKATYLRSQDFIGIANVILDNKTLDTFQTYQLNSVAGDFYNLSMFVPADESSNITLSTVFENLDFHVPDSEISFRGVDGSLVYVKDNARLELLSEAVVMDFGSLFRQPLAADLLQGLVFVTHKDNSWQVTAENFYFLNMDVEIDTRLKIVTNENGGLFADIQSDFRNAIGSSIHKYYPVPIMSDDLLAWLAMAITDGYVESGSFILRGDLSGFPYAENDGVMQVVFDTSYLTLNFLEDWPSLDNLSSHVRFHNSSLSVTEASGQTYRGRMTQAEVLIPDLNAPRLFIDGHINAPAKDLQQYVWDSGLNDILGEAMNEFQASGETELELKVEVPLGNDDAILARGAVQLKGNELYFPIMDYALNNVSGRLSFDGDQLTANGIQAVFENAPVSIDVKSIEVLASDTKNGNDDNSFDEDETDSETVFSIKGRLPIDGMLKKFKWIPDAWATGASDWDVAVHLPKQIDDYSIRVEMSSNLEGTVISLSDAVSKPQDEVLPINVEIKALEDALQVEVESEQEFSLFATRDDGYIWNFIVDSSLISGNGEFSEDLNKDSTASLDLEYIDLLRLFKSTKKGGSSMSFKPTFFPSLKLKSKVLLWNDWEFNNTEFDSSWHSHGMLINSISLKGPSLEVKGRGSWLSSWQHEQESNFKFFVNSSNLGHTMSTLNLSDAMKGCEQSATVDWRWFDEPYRFSWQTVQGSSHFQMKNGAVKELDPGASGRIVGLLNVFKLFDRLTLDFKDVAAEGFAFDLIEGDFDFHDGLASSSNIEVSAAAADMKLTGDIGMVNRDYDLLMQVRPRSSAAAFTGGTIAGGPVLGAGLVLINKLLGLEKSSYDEYKITGSWEEPLVEQIEQRRVDDEAEVDAGE